MNQTEITKHIRGEAKAFRAVLRRHKHKHPGDRRRATVFNVDLQRTDVHPRLALVPMIGECAESLTVKHHHDPARMEAADKLTTDWAGFVANVKANGVLDPIKVIRGQRGRYLVVDGRNRRRAALEAGWRMVPAILARAEDVDKIIAATVIGRRHWTKGQKAWLAVLLNPEICANRKGKVSDLIGKSREDLGAEFGVSADLIDQAAALYQKFYTGGKQNGLGEKHEMSIWAGFGLGAVLAGLAGAVPTEGQPRPKSNPDSVYRNLASINRQLAQIEEWDADQMLQFQVDLERWSADLPEKARNAIRRALDHPAAPAPPPSPAKSALAKPQPAKRTACPHCGEEFANLGAHLPKCPERRAAEREAQKSL